MNMGPQKISTKNLTSSFSSTNGNNFSCIVLFDHDILSSKLIPMWFVFDRNILT